MAVLHGKVSFLVIAYVFIASSFSSSRSVGSAGSFQISPIIVILYKSLSEKNSNTCKTCKHLFIQQVA